jgi:hypothetical protein
VTEWSVVWLAVIAIAVALMALIQIVVLAGLALLVRQAIGGVRDLRREIRPLLQKVDRIADDATRVSGMAVAEVERLSALVRETSARIDETVAVAQRVVMGPVRQGSAIFAAARAIFSSFRSRSTPGRPPRHTHDDEDPLFVG